MPWMVVQNGDRYCVHKKMADGSMGAEVPGGCHPTMEEAQRHMRALYANMDQAGGKSFTFLELDEEIKSVWTTAYVNSLPDSSFAFIGSGGSKDSEGKTTPRSLRHFPYKDAQGHPDAAHVRNALARIPQSNVPDSAKASALAKVQAAAKQLGIQTSEGKSLMDETVADALVYYGGAVKALGDGRLGGYLVEFSDPETRTGSPDLDLDFFAGDTDYDLEDNKSATVYYDHGRDPVLKRRKLAKATMRPDDVGVWVETQLALRDNYEKAIYRLAELGKLGWSSGTAPHLVERKRVGNFNKIVAWPLGDDASLTPTPSSHTRTNHAIALKSTAARALDEMISEMDQLDESTPPQFKSQALDDCMSAAYNDDLDTHSLKVATAVEELLTHYAKTAIALDVLGTRLANKQEFRAVKDGRAISQRRIDKMNELIGQLKKLADHPLSIATEFEKMVKEAVATRAQRDALHEAIQLQHNQFQQLKESQSHA